MSPPERFGLPPSFRPSLCK